MVAQLRLLDPSASAEIGTPERKILDTVAQSLADSQIDLTVLQGSLDLDSKFGGNLDRFISLFGFGRQQATYASGFVTLGRLVPATSPIRIPSGTRVQATSNGLVAVYATTFDVTLPQGQTSVLAPIKAVTPGTVGNVATGTIITSIGEPILGITTIRNDQPTSGGIDPETDDQLKIRFKNTIFRNLSGTEDQFLALSISTPFATKANVVGPISRYREYIQVPEVADSVSYDINGDTVLEGGNGILSEYTSALSSIPYSKHVYNDVPTFVSNGQQGANSIFYRNNIDFRVNTTAVDKNRGDTFRLASVGSGPNPVSDPLTENQPNITFINVYTGTAADVNAIRPNDVVLFEHSYLSNASRNDIDRLITNAIDVYIDGTNPTQATTVLPAPTTLNLFVDNPASKFHYDNYRRKGERERRPLIGNLLTPLLFQPVTEVPELITALVGNTTYTFERDLHYWAVEDNTILGGSIRSRAGIEWNMDLPASVALGASIFITDGAIDSITVDGYTYDKNIFDLQGALEGAKQVTTDVLVHRARRRFFKLDITVMYTPGSSINDVNVQVGEAINSFLNNQYFGTTVQLSDLLQVIHNTPQIDNVRWTSDVPRGEDLNRLVETDEFGRPLVNVQVDTTRKGTVALQEIQQIVLSGSPKAGNYALSVGGQYTTALPYNASAAMVLAALNAAPVSAGISTVTGTGSASDPFKVTFTSLGAKSLIQGTPFPSRVLPTTPIVNGHRNLYNENFIIDQDFFLQDDELPGLATAVDTTTAGALPDNVPGLVIRPRAQNTWAR